MPTCLLSLSVELHFQIIEQIKRPADLHSLCLVSRYISAISVRYLYQNFVFPPMTAEAAERLCVVLANSHGLLHFVETFRLGQCLRHCSERLEEAFLSLLSKFPDDRLTRFDFNGHFLRPRHQNFLWSHQQKIRNLQLTVITDEVLRRRIDIVGFPYANYSGRLYDLRRLAEISTLQRMGPPLKSLRVQGNLDFRLWEETIITHATLPLVNLKHLTLDNVSLGGHSLDSLPQLTHLAFHNCPSAGQCLMGYTRPTLKALYFFYDPTEFNVLSNFTAFLSRFRGLETLAVRDIWKYISPRAEEYGSQILAAAIGTHEETLSFLLIHFNHQVYNIPSYYVPILEAAKKCKNLSQLGLSLSPGRLEQVCLDLLDHLPSLVTLRIDLEHCMRYFMLWHQYPITENVLYSKLINNIAAKIMAAAASRPVPSKFTLLSIGFIVVPTHLRGPILRKFECYPDNMGSCDCSYGFEVSDAYVFRREGSKAKIIPADQAKDLVPESDIVNFRYRFFNCG